MAPIGKILPIGGAEYPHLIENEAAHLAAARALKLAVAGSDLVHDKSGQPGLLVRRFDRVREGDTWRRLAFEDATQLLGLPPSAKYNIDAVQIAEAITGIVRAPLIAARNLYLQFLFAWLTGNGDLHGKNVGVLQDSEGRWDVAPLYDIPCTLIYDDDSMALPIAGRTKRLRASHWADSPQKSACHPKPRAQRNNSRYAQPQPSISTDFRLPVHR